MRDVINAIFYILRTGCQWRYLPRDLPPKSTVWRYFDQWRSDGTLDQIHDQLRRKVRTQEKPYHLRTTASVDSPSADTTCGGEQRGRDNAKNVDGRKRHIVVDSMGLLLAVLVTAGDCLIPHFPRLTVFASTPLDWTEAIPRSRMWANA
ncbi:MAG: transposase, partial [Isosphaeraceae bacterium]